MYADILIPTDGSEGAKRGVEHALDLAAENGARLHVIYVVDERLYGQTPALSSDELFLEELVDRGERTLEEVARLAEKRDVAVTTACRRGVPHEVILAYAEENDVDLVVMGRHGLSEAGRPHLGSCTERVIRLAKVPVLPV